jgi:hypothetical protein
MVSFLEETGFLKETHSHFEKDVTDFCLNKKQKQL